MTKLRLAASLVAGTLLLGAPALAQADKKIERTTPAFQAKKDDELKKAILEGVEKEKGHSFKSELTPEQVDALVAYVRTFKK